MEKLFKNFKVSEEDQSMGCEETAIKDQKISESVTVEDEAIADEKQTDESGIKVVDDIENIKLVNKMESASHDYQFNKECVNYDCPKQDLRYVIANGSVLEYYKIAKNSSGKRQYACVPCYDAALTFYERICDLLVNKKPIQLREIKNERAELLEIDSSDDDEEQQRVSDSGCYSDRDITLIENELEDVIESVFKKVDIQAQLSWCNSDLIARIRKNQEIAERLLEDVTIQQKKFDQLCEEWYTCAPYNVESIRPIDSEDTAVSSSSNNTNFPITNLPPTGPVEYPYIQPNKVYYCARSQITSSWTQCKVAGKLLKAPVETFRVKFVPTASHTPTFVTKKNLAYNEAPPVQLPVGTRVIAYFVSHSVIKGKVVTTEQNAFYPGVIAESLKSTNNHRYLVFYDDGYVQYVPHKDVRLVCESSANVWEDVAIDSRDFIRTYLQTFEVNRPMVFAQKGQTMNVERNGVWMIGRVITTDCSLLLIQFEGLKNNQEWIYRGSLRLGPVYKEHQKMLQNKPKTPAIQHRVARRAEPFILYSNDVESSERDSFRTENSRKIATTNSIMTTRGDLQRPTIKHLNNSVIYVDDDATPRGQVVYYSAKRNLPPRKYEPHKCRPSCLFKVTNKTDAQAHLAKPLLSGWERGLMSNKQQTASSVIYRSPCGRSMRSMEDVRTYLRATNNNLNVDNFDFSPNVHCLSQYTVNNPIITVADISCGLENIPIPLVNYYDSTLPPECTYAPQRIPTEGVNLNLDEEFLCGCDCEDDCYDKEKCACWRLTAEGARRIDPKTPTEEIGYVFKRLLSQVRSGIYECNSRCKCRSNCLNRVVQRPLEVKLQVFKTSNRGWGLRCLNDVSKGTFICIYAGFLLTEANANEAGRESGDEYFADLDYIENTEPLKEGYESDVAHSDPDEDDAYEPDPEDDDEFRPNKNATARNKFRNFRNTDNNVTSIERQIRNFNPNADMDDAEMCEEKSIRRFFGKNESVYIMDAKHTGNIGRYFNHSCSPNLFVQNVFVDTHDPRFPWVSFFADMDIVAGTELTWNYSYEVGVVPGKVLYCQCGAPNCRQRLL